MDDETLEMIPSPAPAPGRSGSDSPPFLEDIRFEEKGERRRVRGSNFWGGYLSDTLYMAELFQWVNRFLVFIINKLCTINNGVYITPCFEVNNNM